MNMGSDVAEGSVDFAKALTDSMRVVVRLFCTMNHHSLSRIGVTKDIFYHSTAHLSVRRLVDGGYPVRQI